MSDYSALREAVANLPWVSSPDELPADVPVYVYGVGSCGRRWLEDLAVKGNGRLAGVADTFATGTVGGFAVLSADVLAERARADGGVVVLASMAWRAIAEQLLARGATRLVNGSLIAAAAVLRQGGVQEKPFEDPAVNVSRDPTPARFPEGVRTEDLYLSDPRLIQRFILELTDQCTFRCLYCHQNIPGFAPRHTMSDELLDYLVGFLTRHRMKVTVDLTGAGDITMAPRWHERCDALLDGGVGLTATVNLARTLGLEELRTFSRFSVLAVSCDSVDSDVFRSIRRSMDIRTVVYNMAVIRSLGVSRGTSEPLLMITATYSAEMVGGIDRLAAFAVAIGAKSFGIQDLVVHTATEHNVHSVWTLTGEAAINAVRRTRAALDLLTRHGLSLSLQPEFLARLDQLERGTIEGTAGPAKVDCGRDITYMEPMRPGHTRDCTDPWTFIQVLGDGTVRPCCFSPELLGKIDAGATLEEIQNGEIARRMRDGLLTGRLDKFCSVCNFRKQIPIEEYRAKIGTLVRPAIRR